MEITEEQKKLAAKFEEEQNEKKRLMEQQRSLKEKGEAEAEAVTKFLMGLEMKLRRTQLIVQNPKTQKHMSVNSSYLLGKYTKIVYT